MTTIEFPSSVVFSPTDRLKPSLGVGAAFRDPTLRRVYLEFNSNGLGDVVNLVPLIQEIGALRPDIAILMVSSQWKIPFRWTAPNVSTLQAPPPKADRNATGTLYFDLTPHVRFHLYCPHWLQFFFITGIGTYTGRGDPFPLLDEREVASFSSRLSDAVGNARGYILVHLENTRQEWEGRNTDPENLLAVARVLAKNGYRVLEIGNENPPSGEFAHLGMLTLEELIYAMKFCDGFVGIDSFPMHLAALYDKPLLGFFAATQPEVVLPPVTRLTLLRNEAIPCNGCVYITRPRDYNRCTLGHLECTQRLPESYLMEQLADFERSIEGGIQHLPMAAEQQHSWRMAQLLFEESLLLDRARGKRFVPNELRRRIAASISSEIT